MSDAPTMPEEVWVDGQPHPVGPDGTADIDSKKDYL